ncbi:MAG TPA: hypothetical protein VHZ30_06520 [Verrucomicrobiae bacterium]|jgi:hypothetical protein|nr:hypothetical protein [Verrucomicrobiae bacterium]
MRTFGWLMLAVIFAAGGCVSSRKAKMEAGQAYIQGQQQAMQAQQRAIQAQGPCVFFQGPVRNQIVPWREGMKLSEAIVAADYTAFMNPEMIRVMRNGQVAGELKGIDLLRHQDLELQPGDTVIILP